MKMQDDASLFVEKRLEKAVDTARMLMKESAIISKMVLFQVYCFRLLILAYSVLENEVENGWEIEEEGYVLDILKATARECVLQNPISAAELHRNVQDCILPILEVLAFHEES